MNNLDSLIERQQHIRNFSIIAHIDHGKSTIADRIMEKTDTVSKRELHGQMLDTMELEQERGITIKLNSIELKYRSTDGHDYFFHLIDTPGHVDFAYEVSRSLAAAEGALLVVDASQGVEAQTLANAYLAIDNNLEILPVVNKIDLPAADINNTVNEIENVIGLPADSQSAVYMSAKTGVGVDDLLEKIVHLLPAPTGDIEGKLKALIFDSEYDPYRGVVVNIRVRSGIVKKGDKILMMNSKASYEVTEVGVFSPDAKKRDFLMAGDVGYLTASIKDIQTAKSGETITLLNNPAEEPLPGYRNMNPTVYAGMYPVDNQQFEELRDALEKLQLNDASLAFEPETSQALGFGFRVGFLGLLHMDVIQERLEREFDLELVTTAPSVTYKVVTTDGQSIDVLNPADMPDASQITEILEPYVTAHLLVPKDYVGPVMELSQQKRGEFITMSYIDDQRVDVQYSIPLSEIIYDFFDKLKSSTKGYASLDYDFSEYRISKLQKIDILLNGDKVDMLSFIVHQDFAQERGRIITSKLKNIIPRQNFEIPVQAAIGSKILARTNIKAYRKDVTSKIHTGDPDRRAKLLDKQKRGKERMKEFGKVAIPQDAFMAVLKTDEDDEYKKG